MEKVNENLKEKSILLICVVLLFFSSGVVFGQSIPAFPGAEGFGANTSGGRGGKIIEVTNLKDSGSGSFRDAIKASGPRIVVFKVSGTIELKSDIMVTEPKLTVAGQTAPGDGICLRNKKLQIQADDVIVRYMRFRRGRGDGKRDDALSVTNCSDVIVDHCSFSWGTDETLNTWHGSKNLTIQWCIVSEALHHNKHGFAATLGGVNASYHHLLIANCPGRNPSIGGNHKYQTHNLDFRNSVLFNFGYRTFDGKPSSINIVNNYFKPGPNTTVSHFANIDKAGVYQAIPTTAWYVTGNVWHGNDEISKDNSKGLKGATEWVVDKPNDFAPVTTVSAEEAYKMVLKDVGATLPKRDSLDTRIIKEVETGKTTYGKGVVLDQNKVGGWPKLSSAKAPLDSDKDGMPDQWEKDNGLNPNDASDRNKKSSRGYTMVEEYINGIGGADVPVSPGTGGPTPLKKICGDADLNGTVNIVDALLIAQYSVGISPAYFDISPADVNGDNVVNIVDALLVAQYYVGIIKVFNGC